MASQVILKKSSVAARVPVVGDLAFGELALNYQDGLLYYKKADSTISTIGGAPISSPVFTGTVTAPILSISGGTIDGVGYLNASKVLTTGSVLRFDGTNLFVGSGGALSYININGAGNGAYIKGQRSSTNHWLLGDVSSVFGYGTGMLSYVYGDDPFIWCNGGATTERMRITGTGGISFGTTGVAYGSSGQILQSNGNASPTWVNLAVLPSNFASQTATTVLAAPTLANGVPTFRTLTLEDIPDAWVKKSVSAATTANITLSAPQTIDGIVLVAGNRVLVKDQTLPATNGIYVVAAAAWTRALDADTVSKIAGAHVNIDSGTVNGGLSFDTDLKVTDVLNTTVMAWYRNIDAGYTIPITQGGTGATSISQALNNLGAYASNNPSGYISLTSAITGYVVGTNATLTATDTINAALGKLQGQVTARGVGTVTGVTATAPVVSSGGTAPVISMAAATSTVNGYLTAADWATFNGKQAAGAYITLTSVITGYVVGTNTALAATDTLNAALGKIQGQITARSGTVTGVTATAPVVSSGGTAPVISMAAATTSVAGYLTAADWTTFNNKQAAGSYLTTSNYTSYSPTLTGGSASGTWGISVTGSAASVTGGLKTINGTSIIGSGDIAVSVGGLTINNASTPINPINVTQNQIGYANSLSILGQTDGGLYTAAYDSSWMHQIFGDFRTGQIAVRGKNSGTFQAWRTVLDSSNYSSYALPLSGGTMTGSTTIGTSNYIRFGPNPTWASTLQVGGDGVNALTRTATIASVVTTNGNLHLDSGSDKAVYLNFYSGTGGIIFGNGALGQIGSISSAGALTMNSNITAYSDERLKKDWNLLPSDFVQQLSLVKVGTYTRIDSNERQVGISAQSLKNLMPEAVIDGEYLSVAYGNAALASAVELAKEVVSLNARIARLEALVSKLIEG